MWKEAAMSLKDSLTVSLLGLSVVFLMLLVLMAAILIISWIVRRAIRRSRGEPAPEPEDTLEAAEITAVLMAVISQEAETEPWHIEIKSIKELSDLG